MISFLSEESPRLLGLTQSSDVWNSRTCSAVVRETFTGSPEVWNVMPAEVKSQLRRADERIRSKVYFSFDCISSTWFERRFSCYRTDGLGMHNLLILSQKITATYLCILIHNIWNSPRALVVMMLRVLYVSHFDLQYLSI